MLQIRSVQGRAGKCLPSRCYITGITRSCILPLQPRLPEPPTQSGEPVDEPRIPDDFRSVLHAATFLSGRANRRRFSQPCVRKKRIESRVCEISFFSFFPHLSSRKRSAQNRHRLGSARRARVAQLGPEKPEQGSSQSHVSRGIVLTDPVRITRHQRTEESDESCARCCAAGCWMWWRWCKRLVLWVQPGLINIHEMRMEAPL